MKKTNVGLITGCVVCGFLMFVGCAATSPVRSTGGIGISGYGFYSDKPGFNNITMVNAPSSMEDMLKSKLDTKAMIQSSQVGKWMLKLEKGDFFSLTSSSQSPIGLGSEMRFSHENWIDFCGKQYRNGGFSVKDIGVEFFEGTERNDEGKAMKYIAGQWKLSQ
jgi:hypothetical protein